MRVYTGKLYPKIELAIDGNYVGTTRQFSSLKSALNYFKDEFPMHKGKTLIAYYPDSPGSRKIRLNPSRSRKTIEENNKRAKRAERALIYYEKILGLKPTQEDLETLLTDLITDSMHLLTPDMVSRAYKKAVSHYNAEVL